MKITISFTFVGREYNSYLVFSYRVDIACTGFSINDNTISCSNMYTSGYMPPSLLICCIRQCSIANKLCNNCKNQDNFKKHGYVFNDKIKLIWDQHFENI